MKDYIFIVNPVSGKGRALNIIKLINEYCKNNLLDYSLIETKNRTHATQIAASYENLAKNIISVGGDGTLNEVINGIGENSSVNIGVLPVGSGNDFVKNLNYPKNIKDILSILVNRNMHKIVQSDLGLVNYSEENSNIVRTRKFINNMGIGFDAHVGALNQDNKISGGIISYLYSVVRALFNYEMINLSKLNGVEEGIEEKLMISIGNGICSGGGFYLNPKAIIDDGRLDVSIFDKVTRRRLLRALPLAMINKLNKVPEAKMETTEYLEIELKNPYYAHCDGEIISTRLNKAEISVLKNKLNVITSAGD